MTSFVHDTLAQRVILEAGKATEYLQAELERLGRHRVMLIAAEHEARVADQVAGAADVTLR